MKTVYHLFDARKRHHTLRFIETFDSFHRETHSSAYYVLYNYDEKTGPQYRELSERLGVELITFNSGSHMLRLFLRHLFDPDSIFVLHGDCLWYYIFSFLLFFRKNKVLWVNWGSGLNPHPGVKGAAYDGVKRLLYGSLDGINTLMTPDAEVLTQKLRYRKRLTTYSYFSVDPQMDPDETAAYFNDNKINVLIGNHAGSYHNHIKWMKEFARFEDSDIRIIIFAGYKNSDKGYLDELDAYGEKHFGDMYCVFTSLLDLATYRAVMKSVDILVIDVQHQSGLGAIGWANFYGGNIYLRPGSANEAWMKERGIITFSTDDILTAENVNQLLRLTEAEKKANLEIVRRARGAVDENKRRWYDFLYGTGRPMMSGP